MVFRGTTERKASLIKPFTLIKPFRHLPGAAVKMKSGDNLTPVTSIRVRSHSSPHCLPFQQHDCSQPELVQVAGPASKLHTRALLSRDFLLAEPAFGSVSVDTGKSLLCQPGYS